MRSARGGRKVPGINPQEVLRFRGAVLRIGLESFREV